MTRKTLKRWLAAVVFVSGFGLGLDWAAGTFEATPSPTDPVSEGDDRLRELKQQVRRRLQIETHFGSTSSNDNGLLREGSGRAFHEAAAPANLTGGIGAYIPATEGNNNAALSTSTTAGAEIQGEGRLWVDSDGGAAANTVTGTNNKLYVYDGANARWEEATAKASNFEDFLGVTANLVANESFEDAADAAATLPLFWTEVDAGQVYAHTDNAVGEGAGHFIRITTDNDANNDGISQTLSGLKGSQAYYLVARVTPSDADYCQLLTTGAGSNIAATSSAASVQTLSGTFTTDGVVTPVVVILRGIEANGGAGVTCDWDYVGVFEKSADRVPTPGTLVQYTIDATSSDSVTATPGWETKGTLTVTVPGPGYALLVDGMANFIDTLGDNCAARISQNIDGGGATTAATGLEGDGSLAASHFNIHLSYAVAAPTVGATYVYTIDGQSETGTCNWDGTAVDAASLRVQLLKQGG